MKKLAKWKIALLIVASIPVVLIGLLLATSIVDSTLKRSEKRVNSIELSDRLSNIHS